MAKEFGIARVHGDWREVVEAKDVDAVCIGTWPYTHCEMTMAALAAGKHVLCEARMAMNAAEGRRMLEASRKAPQLIAQLVPAPHTLEVDRDAQAAARRGLSRARCSRSRCRPASGRASSSRTTPLHWRQDIALSGHNILNMGIWYEAMMRWLGPARRVMAMTKIAVPQAQGRERARWHDVKVPDHVDILASFESGAGRPPALQLGDRARARRPRRGSSAARARCASRPTRKRLSGGRRGDKALTRDRRSRPTSASAGASRRSSSTRSAAARRSRTPPSRTACATWSSPTRWPRAPPAARPST